MKKTGLITIWWFLLILSACNYSGSGKSSDEDSLNKKVPLKESTMVDVDKRVVKHVDNLVDHYLTIKDALVKTDSSGAKAGAVLILREIKSFDTMILKIEHRKEYNNFIGKISESAMNIAGISDIEAERSAFSTLTDNLIGIVKAFGYKKTIYRLHCPMAFNRQGADWLSLEKEIRNPYYGKNMLECGSVEEAFERR